MPPEAGTPPAEYVSPGGWVQYAVAPDGQVTWMKDSSYPVLAGLVMDLAILDAIVDWLVAEF